MRFVLLCAALLVWSVQRPALDARFIGNMAFAITDGAVTLMTDFPYESGYSRYNTYPATEIRSNTASTLSLITHRHGDHWEPSLFAKTDWKVAGPDDVVAGLPAPRVVPLSHHTTFGPIQIERVHTPHANIGHHSYVVTWHGRRLYFSGDTEDSTTLLAAKGLDVAFISPWIYKAVASRRAALDAKRIVIYHHEAGEKIADCRDRCTVPRQGETIRIE
jgi:L-ascorbate metabolism protein UlaG (beta-lactamase superfamily)